MIYLAVFILSFIFSLILTNLLKNLAKREKLINQKGIPFFGGLAIFFSTVLTLTIISGLNLQLAKILLGLLLGSSLILILGLIDDFKELSPLLNFVGQTIAVIVLIFFGLRTHIILISEVLNIIVTLLWILGLTNAFNLLDIMDGLCGGLAFIAALTFFLLAFLSGNFVIAAVSLSLAAATLGFLIFNFPPAKIYLGNSGSMFLGFVLASLAIAISYAPTERKIALFTPILVLGLAIYDLLFVILMRILKRKSPIRKSKDHFALRLIAIGKTKREALVIMYLFGILFSISALLVSRVTNIFGIIIIAFVIIISLLAGRKISKVRVD